jgi:GAF domain-containing protein
METQRDTVQQLDMEQRVQGLLKKVDLEVGTLLKGYARQRAVLEDIDAKLEKLGSGLAMLGPDPHRNIDVIVESVAAVLGAPVSLYNRLDAGRQMLCTWSIFNPPPDYVREDPATGHICFEATMKTDNQAVALEELRGSIWEQTDNVVARYKLRSYLGFPVEHRGQIVGSLCMVDVEPRRFSPTDVLMVHVLAKAMSVEEERKAMEKELEERLRTIERQEDMLVGRTQRPPLV